MKNSSDKAEKTFARMSDTIKKRKRDLKIASLLASNEWKGLEDYSPQEYPGISEDLDEFRRKFRQYYLSGKMIKFRDWLKKISMPLDTID